MKLRIKPFPKNQYPKKALLIKGSSPLVWFQEMNLLGINVLDVRSFAIPSNEPNGLYGCLILFFDLKLPKEIGKNAYFQSVNDTLFIPENTDFYPKILVEEFENFDSEFLVMHPEFGMVKLEEEINWISLLSESPQREASIKKPSNGIKIPKEIESFTLELDQEKLLEALENPKTEEEWMKNLPFDLKKVLAGNKREIEKYLRYIEKYPDRAVDIGVPLDIMGTSRGDGFGKFKFGNGLFGGLFGGNSGSGSSGNFRWVFWVFLVLIGIGRFISKKEETPKPKDEVQVSIQNGNEDAVAIEEVVIPAKGGIAFESGVTEMDKKIDSLYGKERQKLMADYDKAKAALHGKDKNAAENYTKNGGKSLDEVYEEVKVLKQKELQSKDSLKAIYAQKVNEETARISGTALFKIMDSLQKAQPNSNENFGAAIQKILDKKREHLRDSLSKIYGINETKEPYNNRIRNSNFKTFDVQDPVQTPKSTTFSDILSLILLIMGGIILYSLVFRRRFINIGGENVPVGIKIFLMIVLVGMLIYLFYPLVEMFGYNWFVLIIAFAVAVLLYRLFSSDKTILKSDDNE